MRKIDQGISTEEQDYINLKNSEPSISRERSSQLIGNSCVFERLRL